MLPLRLGMRTRRMQLFLAITVLSVSACAPRLHENTGEWTSLLYADAERASHGRILGRINITRQSVTQVRLRNVPCGEYAVHLQYDPQQGGEAGSPRRHELRRCRLTIWDASRRPLADCNLEDQGIHSGRMPTDPEGSYRLVLVKSGVGRGRTPECQALALDRRTCNNDWRWDPIPDPPSVASSRGDSIEISAAQDVWIRLALSPRRQDEPPFFATLVLVEVGDCQEP